MYTGPKLTNDGLVFGYDTGYGIADNETSTRFYQGEPTVNEFYGSGSSGTILDYSTGYGGLGSVQTGVLDAFGTTDNVVYRKTGKLRFGPTGGQDVGTLIYGNTYTFSIYLRHYGATLMSGGEFDIVDQSSGGKNYSGTLSSNMTYDWKRFSVTSTHTNNSNYHFIDVGTYQGTGVFEWCMPQIDVGSHATPFTKTSRSNTQSLIDLKETNDITVANVSFDSTGQPTFDGSDDKIVVPNQISTGSYTYETVVKISSSDSSYSGFSSNFKSDSSGYSGVGNGWVLRLDPNGKLQIYTKNNSTTLLNPINISGFRAANVNKYIHLVYTYSSGTNKLYLNGVLQATGTGLSGITPSDSTLIIGAYSWGISSQTYYINAHQPIAKLYNQTHTATEIKQNFNAYKNRFNI